MKQHITPNQANELTEKQFYSLFNEVVSRKDWANYHHKKITVGKLIEVIRCYCQIDIHTVDDNWCVQLFNLDACTNDLQSRLYENNDKKLVDVLFKSLIWIIRNNAELNK